jgi:hypothetical protein
LLPRNAASRWRAACMQWALCAALTIGRSRRRVQSRNKCVQPTESYAERGWRGHVHVPQLTLAQGHVPPTAMLKIRLNWLDPSNGAIADEPYELGLQSPTGWHPRRAMRWKRRSKRGAPSMRRRAVNTNACFVGHTVCAVAQFAAARLFSPLFRKLSTWSCAHIAYNVQHATVSTWSRARKAARTAAAHVRRACFPPRVLS